MKKHQISDEDFSKVIAESKSIREALFKMNKAPAGGNYETTHKRIKKLGLNTDHFLGQAINRGKKFPASQRPLSDYLNNSAFINSHKLRLKLLDSGLKPAICEQCNLKEWLGKPISLELHHKDGDRDNNNLSNLSILCPNCHAQTNNYRGKNKKK